ncbi:hypothetical protein JX266_007203 [Neoarthrinium moseri]|nr:hypothetical protein JX266_007203 [Neoarthrinium moseri]
MSSEELNRASYLLDAQNKAIALFDEIERDLIRAGVSEKVLSDEIHELATKRHGIKTHWHKRVIRSGPNTLSPFEENPPDRAIEEDDILYVDLGPVFEQWEADFGRTYVLGDDLDKKRLRDSLEPTWNVISSRYHENPDITGDGLFEIACEVAQEAGWEWNAKIAGHIVGSFPHERIPRDKTTLYITKDNNLPMSTPGKDGLKRHWILEVHLRDPARQFAAFHEKLLTIA